MIQPSDKNVSPPCPHYDQCGGCSLQHLDTESYYDYKQSILTKTIDSLGVDNSVIQPIIKVGENNRRRVEFKVAVYKKEVCIGFYGKRSHDVFDLTTCLVSDQKLVSLAHFFKECFQSMKKPSSIKAISLTIVDNGIDATIITNRPLNAKDKQILLDFIQTQNFVRVGEKEDEKNADISVIYSKEEPTITFDNFSVELPTGAFLQATYKGQDEIVKLVSKHLEQCDHIADLYAGCGTYSFSMLNSNKRIAAFEGSEEMVLAMHNAINRYDIHEKMSATVRDLFKNPLRDKELSNFDGIVINPSRNGALPQIKQIAKSNVPFVTMVSCNPTTFERDIRYLLESGYKLTSATAIDQFYWTNHLEVVAQLHLQK